MSANLKAVFPLTAANKLATYNWEIGTIQRPDAAERQFEVASHHWIDLTDESGSYGATILTDVKNGSDKRDDHTIRLTLLRTPGYRFPDERGRTYTDSSIRTGAITKFSSVSPATPATGDRRRPTGRPTASSTPLIAFDTAKHPGTLGKQLLAGHRRQPARPPPRP